MHIQYSIIKHDTSKTVGQERCFVKRCLPHLPSTMVLHHTLALSITITENPSKLAWIKGTPELAAAWTHASWLSNCEQTSTKSNISNKWLKLPMRPLGWLVCFPSWSLYQQHNYQDHPMRAFKVKTKGDWIQLMNTANCDQLH